MIWICLSKRCIPANLLNCHRKVKNMMWKLRIWQKPSGRRSFTRIVVNSSRASHVDVSFTRKHPPKNVVVHPSQALSMSRSASTADIRWLETEMVHIPQSELSSDFRRLVLSGKSLYSRIPAFVFRGMGGAKVINRQGHASLPSFSALPFKMPRFTSIGTFFRWKNIKPAWNTWNSMICWLSHLTSLMYLSHLVYPLPVPPIFLDDFCIFCAGLTRPKHPFFSSAARAWSGPCQFLRQCSRLPGVKAWIMPRSSWVKTPR